MFDLFIFDIDGTLTPSRQKMEQSFEDMFTAWAQNKTIYLVTGSDYEKVCEQVPPSILGLTSGVFACQGAEFWRKGVVEMRRSVAFPDNIMDILLELAIASKSPIKTGQFIEVRSGMLNFTTVGRDANINERKLYNAWDSKTHERQYLVKTLSERFPKLEFRIGGEISIDIALKGMNKSQILPHLQHWHKNARMAFFGDKMVDGGNDLPLKLALSQLNSKHVSFPVRSPQETEMFLKSISSNVEYLIVEDRRTKAIGAS